MTVPTIEAVWQEFAAIVGLDKPGVSAGQREDMRRAFFAGAAEMFFTYRNKLAELPDEEARREITKLENEIRGFAQGTIAKCVKGRN